MQLLYTISPTIHCTKEALSQLQKIKIQLQKDLLRSWKTVSDLWNNITVAFSPPTPNSQFDWQSTSFPVSAKGKWGTGLSLTSYFSPHSCHSEKEEKKNRRCFQWRSYRGVAEEAEYDHDEGGGEYDAEHDAGQRGVDQRDDHVLCSDQDGAGPAVQRAPQLQGAVGGLAAPERVRRRHHDPWPRSGRGAPLGDCLLQRAVPWQTHVLCGLCCRGGKHNLSESIILTQQLGPGEVCTVRWCIFIWLCQVF